MILEFILFCRFLQHRSTPSNYSQQPIPTQSCAAVVPLLPRLGPRAVDVPVSLQILYNTSSCRFHAPWRLWWSRLFSLSWENYFSSLLLDAPFWIFLVFSLVLTKGIHWSKGTGGNLFETYHASPFLRTKILSTVFWSRPVGSAKFIAAMVAEEGNGTFWSEIRNAVLFVAWMNQIMILWSCGRTTLLTIALAVGRKTTHYTQ